MDSIVKERGSRYEELLLRSFELSYPDAALGADRRVYYLLHYIRIGVDLRETGYTAQFIAIKENVVAAFQQLLQMELHRHERIAINQLQRALLQAHTEENLDKLIAKALDATSRLARTNENAEV